MTARIVVQVALLIAASGLVAVFAVVAAWVMLHDVPRKRNLYSPVCAGRMECRWMFGSGAPRRQRRYQVTCLCGVSGPVREREDDAWTGWETLTVVAPAALEAPRG